MTLNIRIRILEEGKPKRWGTAIEETYHGMKDHLELEAGLNEAYEEISEKIEDQEARRLFHMMAMDEKRHHEMLLSTIKVFERIFREMLK